MEKPLCHSSAVSISSPALGFWTAWECNRLRRNKKNRSWEQPPAGSQGEATRPSLLQAGWFRALAARLCQMERAGVREGTREKKKKAWLSGNFTANCHQRGTATKKGRTWERWCRWSGLILLTPPINIWVSAELQGCSVVSLGLWDCAWLPWKFCLSITNWRLPFFSIYNLNVAFSRKDLAFRRAKYPKLYPKIYQNTQNGY